MKSAPAPTSAATETGSIDLPPRAPSPRRLSRKVLLGGALAVGSIVALALLVGLSARSGGRERAGDGEAAPAIASPPPDKVRDAPARYDRSNFAPAPAPDMAPIAHDIIWGDRKPPVEVSNSRQTASAGLAPPKSPGWINQTPAARSASASPDGEAQARASSVFFPSRPDNGAAAASPARAAAEPTVEGGGRREAFLSGQRRADDVLDAHYAPPRSDLLLLAGAIIPAALITAVNADLPGRVIAQVTEPVFDSISGRQLLIPQGARLIGAYDSRTTHGDRRLFLVWSRLIMPNGWSIALSGMDATDPAGASGLTDRIDNHLGPLAGAVGLSAVMSVIANRAQGGDAKTLGQNVGDAAAQEAAKAGGRIVDRDLEVRPTLRVRPGAPVRVLVTRDIVLRPYGA